MSIGYVQVQRNFFNSRNTCVVEKYAIEVCFVNLGQMAIANLILGYCFAGLAGIRDGRSHELRCEVHRQHRAHAVR